MFYARHMSLLASRPPMHWCATRRGLGTTINAAHSYSCSATQAHRSFDTCIQNAGKANSRWVTSSSGCFCNLRTRQYSVIPLRYPRALSWCPPNTLQRRGAHSQSNSNPLDLPAIDQKWQKRWKQRPFGKRHNPTGLQSSKEKSYILPMFPYPSGNLHMGHLRVYTISDVLTRWKFMNGHEVLNPMGWDAFGLPAENAAIERGLDPSEWTADNIARMRDLLRAINTEIAWDKEISTCDPDFYKHTQKLFLLLLEHGLAYRAEASVNWDPVDKTVLANEQVSSEGFSWRSGAKVEQRLLTQWFLKISEFRESLLEDLEFLARNEQWPERVLAMQRNWIGRSQGAKLKFALVNTDGTKNDAKSVEVFTTRPDTLFGVQYIAVSLTHPLVLERTGKDKELERFVNNESSSLEKSKAGYLLNGIAASNPIAAIESSPQYLSSPIPIYVAPYVLDGYGESAVMGVPGHDERDYEFWRKNQADQLTRCVIVPMQGPQSDLVLDRPYTDLGRLADSCGDFKGLTSHEASQIIVKLLERLEMARSTETWKLRDWLISRQRSWGTPIPIIHCESCGPVPVPLADLPVQLPKLDKEKLNNKPGNPLEHASDWLHTHCPKCSKPARRETDTMDTFVDSSWYFMRFTDTSNTDGMFSKSAADSLLPVDVYIGGIEHAILHLLYARFISKFLSKVGYWPRGNQDSVRGEPFRKLISQGMVHGKTYSDPDSGRFVRPEEMDFSTPEPRIKASGLVPSVSFQKMSKSKYNGVDPSACVNEFGADAVRAHTLFAAPVTDVLDWDDAKIVGIQRWFGRVWRHVLQLQGQLLKLEHGELPKRTLRDDTDLKAIESQTSAWLHTQQYMASIEQSYQSTSLNVLVSDLMKLTQHVIGEGPISPSLSYHQTSILLRAMAPVAPAFAAECWQQLHHTWCTWESYSPSNDVFDEPFPTADNAAISASNFQDCTVQENGKFRFVVTLPVMPGDAMFDPESWMMGELHKTDDGADWFRKHAQKKWKKIIIARKGKVVNFVG